MILDKVADFTPPAPAGSSTMSLITCHEMLFEKRLLFMGLSTGNIVIFRRRIDSQGVEHIDQKPVTLEGHTGVVRCMLLVRGAHLGQEGYLLFSGGADRTVRMWDPSAGPKNGTKQLVQTLRGHGGTVTSIAYCEGVLVTASTDMSIKIWRQDDGRELLLYPWFSPHQSLGDLDCWVNDIALTVGEAGALYVGDEHGGLSAYRVERNESHGRSATLEVSRWRQKPKAHAFGIEKLRLVVEESLLITSGYDNCVKLWDSQSGALVFTIENEHKCRFTALQWEASHVELILGDELGYIYFWNIATERCVKTERLRDEAERTHGAIKTISTAAGEVLAASPVACGAWLVVRDVKYSDMKGHEGPVVALCESDAGSDAARQRAAAGGFASGGSGAAGAPAGAKGGDSEPPSSSEPPLIYSASLDNTIRAYDPYDMATLSILHEEQSEISCMHVSALSDFVITGNDDGSIRLWNPDSGSTISLQGHANTVTCLDVAVRGATELLISSGFDAHVGIWDITKRKNSMPRLEHIFRAHDQEVLCLLSNPMNATFCTGGNDKCVHVYSLGSATSTSFPRVARLEGHKEPVTCLALDGNFLLSGDEGGCVCVWEMHSFMHLGTLSIHAAAVEQMLIVPENGLLISCSTDSTVRVWDYGNAEQVQVWRHHEEFRCLALRRTTGHVLAGTEQGSIVAFPLSDLKRRDPARGATEGRDGYDPEAAPAEAAEPPLEEGLGTGAAPAPA